MSPLVKNRLPPLLRARLESRPHTPCQTTTATQAMPLRPQRYCLYTKQQERLGSGHESASEELAPPTTARKARGPAPHTLSYYDGDASDAASTTMPLTVNQAAREAWEGARVRK
jgi:hypothetical protein